MISLTRQAARLATSLVLAAIAVAALAAQPAAAEEPPYDDPASAGLLTLCDESLARISGGATTDAPFVWRAVGPDRAPAPYDDENRKAVLYAFQPRQGVDPGLWSGELLTAASRYTNVDHPMAQATPIDFPLRVFLSRFPARWDGYLQLRMYYTTVGAPTSTEYITADIRVDGDSWTMVRGGSAPCDAGDATSDEELLPNFEKSVRAVEAKADRDQRRNAEEEPPSGGPTAVADDPSSANAASDQAGAVDGAPSQSSLSLLVFGAMATAMAVAALVFWWTRRGHG